MSRSDASQRLPTGTVTLLFADVEGSTRLLHRMGERFAPARTRMREIVRAAASEHRGAEVDWAGDGVFLAFSRAGDAIGAAVEIQRSLAAEPWPEDEAHRLRVGVHTGEPELGADGYVGMDVVVASRVCAAAHGEQVVVTRATRNLAGRETPDGASFRPLGRHRLKDVPTPVEVFQLHAPGMRQEFPPLKTLGATSLPALHHRLVGRADALARVETMLHAGARVVSITGPGGAGKSRLALEVAARAAVDRPVHLVGLAPVLDVDLVPGAIGRAVGARESASDTLLDSVANALHGTGALLFLDNLEHLPGVAVQVAELLDRAPDLQVLATSRSPLRLSTEHVFPLQPLSIEDAATLFIELAAARGVLLQDDALASVHAICRRLDGLPLAIELVAARLAVLPPREILRALGEGLALEMEGPVDLPERQRTLRAAIDWSYERLTSSQRDLHAVIAVFADSGSLEDVRQVAGEEANPLRDLEALVGWSLIRSEATDGELRLSMLETVREHALERAAVEGTLDDLRQRHAEQFVARALEAESGLSGPDQAAYLARLERDYDNLTTALDWLLSTGRPADALRAISALERFWRGHAHVTEARRWLALALELAEDLPPALRAAALRTAAILAAGQSDWPAAESALVDARAVYADLGDRREEVLASSYLSFFATRQGEVDRGETYAQEAVAIAADLDDERAQSGALSALADVYSARGRHDLAVASYEQAAGIRARLGDPLLIADATYALGKAAFQAEDASRARRELQRALEQARAIGEEGYIAASLFVLSLLDLREGDGRGALARAGEAFELYSHLGDDRSRARCVLVVATAAAAAGETDEAARLLAFAHALRGDEPADEFESPLLAQWVPELEAQLGSSELARLIEQGASDDPDRLAALVTAHTRA